MQTETNQPRNIVKLDENVISLIAAGEVIHRPANAIKELLENSLDAKSSAITIVVKDGGLKFLQIKDNGCGIKKADLPIVCERFTTSKLKTFDDLKTVSTYGFRGEALSSMSHVSHLSIVTMTVDDTCAWRAVYKDSKLLSQGGEDITPIAGVKGTTITIEDMFYNVPSRKKALQKPQEEFMRVVDVVTKYAIHNSGVAINLKKKGENASAVNTLKTFTISDSIRAIYGQDVAKCLINIKCEDDVKKCKVDGYITNPNYQKKKNEFIVFINHRLVDCKPLKKTIEALYSNLLPRGSHPFLYFSLELDPRNVDVNIHPTKAEVRFLNQDEIISMISEAVQAKLEETNSSRTFMTQSLLTSDPATTTPTKPGSNTTPKKPALSPNQMVRTDSRVQTLDAFVQTEHKIDDDEDDFVMESENNNNNNNDNNNNNNNSNKQPDAQAKKLPPLLKLPGGKQNQQKINIDDDDDEDDLEYQKRDIIDETNRKSEQLQQQQQQKKRPRADDSEFESAHQAKKISTSISEEDFEEITKKKKLETKDTSVLRKPISAAPVVRVKPQLSSVENLMKRVKELAHPGLTGLFKNYSFVGCVNDNLALIQHQTELFLCNVPVLSKEFIYQECLHKFGEFPQIKFSSPASLHKLCMLALDCPGSGWREEDGSKEEISDFITQHLIERRQMLHEYYRMQIDENGDLLSLPQIIPNYKPEIGALATFILRLGTEVDWDSEQECFDTLSRELAEFFCLQFEVGDDEMDGTGDITNSEITQKKKSRAWTIEHVFFPAFRQRFLAPKAAAEDGTIVRIASLQKLYKVFERC